MWEEAPQPASDCRSTVRQLGPGHQLGKSRKPTRFQRLDGHRSILRGYDPPSAHLRSRPGGSPGVSPAGRALRRRSEPTLCLRPLLWSSGFPFVDHRWPHPPRLAQRGSSVKLWWHPRDVRVYRSERWVVCGGPVRAANQELRRPWRHRRRGCTVLLHWPPRLEASAWSPCVVRPTTTSEAPSMTPSTPQTLRCRRCGSWLMSSSSDSTMTYSPSSLS